MRQSGVTALTVNNNGKLRAPALSRGCSTSANAPSSPQQQWGERRKPALTLSPGILMFVVNNILKVLAPSLALDQDRCIPEALWEARETSAKSGWWQKGTVLTSHSPG